MLLISDAVGLFVKGLAELNIIEELEPMQMQCRKAKTWPFGSRIITFLKEASKLKNYNENRLKICLNF